MSVAPITRVLFYECSPYHWRDVESAAGWFTVPRYCWQSLANWQDNESAARRTTMPWHCSPFPCLLVQWQQRGGTMVACFCAGGGEGHQAKVCRHFCAMAVLVRPTIVPLDSRLSLACSQMARMEAARTDGGGSGSDASNGGGKGSALSAVPSLARATTSWWWGGQQCLSRHRRSVEGQGRNIWRRFLRSDGPLMFALGGH